MRALIQTILLTLCTVLYAATAHAQCITPSGSEGSAIYFKSAGLLSYCGGTAWKPMGPPAGMTGTGLPNDNSLIGWWPLDEVSGENVTDVSSSNLSGDWNESGADEVSDNTTVGIVGNALTFNGANTSIALGTSDTLNLYDDFTITAWINPNDMGEFESSNGIDLGGIFSRNSTNGFFFELAEVAGDDVLVLWSEVESDYIPSTKLITRNVWQHVAVTKNASDQVTLYIDGNPAGTGVLDIAPDSGSQAFIGSWALGEAAFDGKIDDVRVYDRALSAQEIAACCNQPIVTDGLVAHWKLDETSGTDVIDYASNHNGTMQGGLTGADSVDAKLGTGLHFTRANNEFVQIPHNTDFNVTSYTLAAWVKGDYPSDGSGSGIEKIVSKDFTFILNWDHAVTGGASCEHWSGGTWESTGDAPDLSADTWHHLACTYDAASQNYILYVNGVETNRNTSVPGNTVDTDDVVIGRWTAANGSQNIDGDIDDVRIYDRALSAAEVAQLARAFDGNLQYNADARVPEFFNGNNWSPMGQIKYIPNAVFFDQTNDYLDIASDLTGTSDCNQFTGSFWFRREDTTGGENPIYDTTGVGSWIGFATGGASDPLVIRGRGGGSTYLELQSTTTFPDTGDGWHHIMWSYDLDDVNKRHLYTDGVEDLNVITFNTGNNIDLTYGGHFIAQNDNLTQKYGGALADVWFDFCTYTDLSIPSNRAKFYNSRPVYLGYDGSTPTGTAPEIFLSGDTESWHTNKGVTGGFTENGELTDATTKPGGVEALTVIAPAVLSTADSIGDNPDAVAISGNHAYILVSGQLSSVDVSTPSSPTVSDTLAVTASGWIDIAGNYAYVTSRGSDLLTVIDISDPSDLSVAGSFSHATDLDGPNGLTVSGNYAYITKNAGFDVVILDVSNPASISVAGRTTANAAFPQDVALSDDGNYIYVAAYNSDFAIYNVSNPAAPTLSALLDDPDLGGAWGIAASGNYAYVATREEGHIAVIDVSNPASPSIVHTITGTGTAWVHHLDIQGDYLYATSESADRLSIIDISTPASASVLYSTADAVDMESPMGVVVSGEYAYVASRGNTDALTVLQIGQKAYCANPSRVQGTIIYNDDGNVMQYCDGEDWQRIGP